MTEPNAGNLPKSVVNLILQRERHRLEQLKLQAKHLDSQIKMQEVNLRLVKTGNPVAISVLENGGSAADW